jgi:hypothetical protein
MLIWFLTHCKNFWIPCSQIASHCWLLFRTVPRNGRLSFATWNWLRCLMWSSLMPWPWSILWNILGLWWQIVDSRVLLAMALLCQPPSLQRPCWKDWLCWVSWSFMLFGKDLAAFTAAYKLLRIFCCCWPIEPLSHRSIGDFVRSLWASHILTCISLSSWIPCSLLIHFNIGATIPLLYNSPAMMEYYFILEFILSVHACSEAHRFHWGRWIWVISSPCLR